MTARLHEKVRAGLVISLVGLAASAVGLLAPGCYSPKIAPGGLACAAPPAKSCPDGFACAGGVCIPEGGGPFGSGGAGNVGSGGATGSGGGGGGAGGSCSNVVTPLCAASANPPVPCDPVCQTGCPCGLRCTVTTAGVACAAPTGTKFVGDVCVPGTDECSPGLVCLREACGTNLGRCFRFCREGTCSGGGVCGTPVPLAGGGLSDQRACNLAGSICDAMAQSGCPDPALKCYVTGPSRTICDCPTGRDLQEGATCIDYNDCALGLACLRVAGASTCHRLCRDSTDCPGCMALGSAGAFCP